MQGLKVAVSIQKPKCYNTAQFFRKYSSSYTSIQLKLSPKSIVIQCIALYSKLKKIVKIEKGFLIKYLYSSHLIFVRLHKDRPWQMCDVSTYIRYQ
jgi:hypothetical protein